MPMSGRRTWARTCSGIPRCARGSSWTRGYGPDWSPFQDRKHLVHQIKLVLINAGIAAVHLASWLMLALGGRRVVGHRPAWPRALAGGTIRRGLVRPDRADLLRRVHSGHRGRAVHRAGGGAAAVPGGVGVDRRVAAPGAGAVCAARDGARGPGPDRAVRPQRPGAHEPQRLHAPTTSVDGQAGGHRPPAG